MAYTNREQVIMSTIAYWDLEEATITYRMQNHLPADAPVPIGVLLDEKTNLIPESNRKKMLKDLEGMGVDQDVIASWNVVAVHNTEPENGFYACVIETEPGKAAVAFRGSQDALKDNNIFNPNFQNIKHDWIGADLGLVNSNQTAQEEEVLRFLQEYEYRGLWDRYEDLTMVGHSLGGALADYATVISVKLGLDKKITQCANLDGPGHSKKFIENHKQEISQVCNKMHHYRWSKIGDQLWGIPGAHEAYISIKQDFFSQEAWSISEIWDITFGCHAREAVKFDCYGNFIESKSLAAYSNKIDRGHWSRLFDGIFYYGDKITYGFFGIFVEAGELLISIFRGDEETPEEAAKRKASEEKGTFPVFDIDPAAFLELARSCGGIQGKIGGPIDVLNMARKKTPPDDAVKTAMRTSLGMSNSEILLLCPEAKKING